MLQVFSFMWCHNRPILVELARLWKSDFIFEGGYKMCRFSEFLDLCNSPQCLTLLGDTMGQWSVCRLTARRLWFPLFHFHLCVTAKLWSGVFSRVSSCLILSAGGSESTIRVHSFAFCGQSKNFLILLLDYVTSGGSSPSFVFEHGSPQTGLTDNVILKCQYSWVTRLFLEC